MVWGRVIAAGLFLTFGLMQDVSAQDFGACGDRADAPAQIAACTAIIDDPTATDAYKAAALLLRCQAQERGDNLDAALADCQQSARLREADPAVHNSLRDILRKLGRYPEALASATRAVALDPDNGGFLNGRATVHCAIGNVQNAYQDRLKALDLGRFTATGLQQALKTRGHYTGRIDGIFGPKSKAGLRAWTQAGCP